MENGLASMPLVDVVELLLGLTLPTEVARNVAEIMISRFGTIERMSKASTEERMSIPGMTERTDQHFTMIGMFSTYMIRQRFGEYPLLDKRDVLNEFCASLVVESDYEMLYVLCLDASMRLIKKEAKISVGVVQRVNVELRHILDVIAYTRTVNVVLCHNHPSGELTPSLEDIQFTRIVKSALEQININLYDHIIIADSRPVSMRKLKLLK